MKASEDTTTQNLWYKTGATKNDAVVNQHVFSPIPVWSKGRRHIALRRQESIADGSSKLAVLRI